ncbi:MAG: glycosyltransferase family 2 protein [Saprospiraceae bacterium]
MELIGPTLSIITICFNDEKYLADTLANIRLQSYPHIQCIIVDGGSTDNSKKIIDENKDIISKWISEKDKGIYDAMNKGISMATGDYILFLNAGDLFFDNNVIEDVMSESNGNDILYGDAIHINPDGSFKSLRHKKIPKKLSWKSFKQGMVVSHQALIIKTSIVQPFNLDYMIASDIDWAIRCTKLARSFLHVGITISKFKYGGISSQKRSKALIERWKIMHQHYGIYATLQNHFIILFKKILFIR